MHSSANEEPSRLGGAEVLVAIAALVSEGRIPDKMDSKSRGFSEGPHCTFSKAFQGHVCNFDSQLCIKYEKIQSYVFSLWQKNIPLCIQVLLVPKCCCENDLLCNMSANIEQIGAAILLEEWNIDVLHRRTHDMTNLNVNQLINAIRSQLYFSQITAWLASPDEKIRQSFSRNSIVYCLTVPGETYGCTKFTTNAQKHNFPSADIGNGIILKVSLSNLPRSEEVPLIKCSKCHNNVLMAANVCENVSVLDDRMQVSCTLKGKHCCEDFDYELENCHMKKVTPKNSDCTPSTSKPVFAKKPCSHCGQPNSDKSNGTTSKIDLELSKKEFDEVLHVLRQNGPVKQKQTDLLNNKQSKGDILLDAILRSSKTQNEICNFKMLTDGYINSLSPTNFKRKCVHKMALGIERNGFEGESMSRNGVCDKSSICDNKNDYINSDNNISRIGENNIYIDINCDTVKRKKTTDFNKMRDISNVFSLEYLEKRQKVKVKQKITFDEEEKPSENHCTNKDCGNQANVVDSKEEKNAKMSCSGVGIPSASDQAKFRKNLDSAASMVFHSRTGLPLTSSPAPVRRGKSCFDFDSSINSVSAIRSALFSLAPNCSTDEDSESDCSIVSPCSPDTTNTIKRAKVPPYKYHRRGQSSGLLGSFEESVLNGRLEPVSTVHGFTAELGASGSFCPRHVILPVTVFFYTLGDNDKVSTPYLGHINLGKKGYNVPKSGTIQVTLFNPLGTVVKMFVIMYDLSDMPANSQTFIRQRTLYMPANYEDKNVEWSQKWLRYLVHLRFMSSKSGRIYLHSDIRMIICRKSDLDTATAHGIDMSYELRSFTHSPTNPKFSPRK